MRNKGLFRKLLFIFSVNLLAVLAVFMLSASYYMKKNNTDIFAGNLADGLAVTAPYVSELYSEGKVRLVNGMSGNKIPSGFRLTVINPDGTVAADSETDPSSMENHLGRPEVRGAMEKGYGRAVRRSSTVGADLLYVAEPLYDGNGKLLAVIRMAAPVREISLFSASFIHKILFPVLIMFLLSFISVYIFSRRMSGRISELNGAFGRLAGGDFGARTHIRSGDELEGLSDNFNAMADRMGEMFRVMKTEHAGLDRIVKAVSDIILVTDAKGVVILSNRPGYEGKYCWEIFGRDIFDKSAGKSLPSELRTGGRYYSCSVSSVPDTENSVAVLHDITDIRNLETIKDDFISNMSHELKTPLSSIKAYLELISEEEDEEIRKEYLSVIERNNDRLSRIVNDIMLLSAVEWKKRVEPEDFDMDEVFTEVKRMLAQKAAGKGLALEFSGSGINVSADRFYIGQALINLVDNAIRYTEKGSVKVSARKAGKGFSLSVADTGIGISAADLPRIFERFFVADKSRSRKTGGTGLGLSIVKHIAEAHGGAVSVSSVLGKGSVFTVTVP